MQLIVIVKKLNKRTLVPASLPDPSNIIGVVLEGFRFEGMEADATEIRNPALGKWYKDRDGFFYWGGGLTEMLEAAPEMPTASPELFEVAEVAAEIAFDQAKMSWGHQFYDIPFIWNDLGTMGKGVTVAVIDTGVDITHDDLVSNIHPLSKSFVGNATDISDSRGHGTNMAGIIGATGKNKVFGIAPEAKLLIVKATPDGTGTDLQKFIDAVNFAAGQAEVDIISISYSFIFNSTDTERKKLIDKLGVEVQKALNNGKIVVASIGDLRSNLSPAEDRDTFPSSFNNGIPENKGVLAVGSFDQNKNVCDFSNSNKHLSILAPGDRSVLTAGINNTVVNGKQTSIAAAFTAGCLALMISYAKMNKPGKIIDYVQTILDTSDDVGPVVGPDPRSGHGRMNLRNAVAKIKML